MTRGFELLAIIAMCGFVACPTWAGGGPHNVLVVVNDQSLDSMELGRYYAKKRNIPQRNICHVSVDPTRQDINLATCEEEIVQPIYRHIDNHDLGQQIRYIVLCKDFPTRVNKNESITSVLFYGYKNAPAISPPSLPCSMPGDTRNPYYMQEQAFEPMGLRGRDPQFLPMLLTGDTLAQAKKVVDRGVASDASLPEGTVYLFRTTDANRSVREHLYDNYLFSSRFIERGPDQEVHTRAGIRDRTDIIGYTTGLPSYPDWFWTTNTYLPGAMTEHLTSLGAHLPKAPLGQSTVLDWLRAGATVTYGSVSEPCAFPEKFPDPMAFYWYARGFTAAESYWMSVANPYQGLFVGDALASPYMRPPVVRLSGIADAESVSGVVTVRVSATASRPAAPCGRIALYVDDESYGDEVHVQPIAWNKVKLSIQGASCSYIVNEGDSLYGITRAVTDEVNALGLPIKATAMGDRIMLLSALISRDTPAISYSASSVPGIAKQNTLHAAGLTPTFLESEAYATRSFLLQGTPSPGDVLHVQVTRADRVTVTNRMTVRRQQKLSDLVAEFVQSINENEELQGAGGIAADNIKEAGSRARFDLRARAPGSLGLMVEISFRVEPADEDSNIMSPAYTGKLEDNWNALTARGNVTLACGYPVLEKEFVMDTRELADGAHRLDVVAIDGTAVQAQGTARVSFVVANTAMTCDLKIEDAHVTLGETITLSADIGGEPVDAVEFMVEGKLRGTLKEPPYSVTIPADEVGPGAVFIQARAIQGGGKTALSARHEVTIGRK